MDLAMPPGPDGLEVTRELRRKGVSCPIAILTMYDDEALKAEGQRAGAQAYILKQAPEERMLETIETWLPARKTSSLLTQRELEVFRLAAEGYSNKEIAGRLAISVKTIESHRCNIALKLGVHSRVDMVRLALDWGLLS